MSQNDQDSGQFQGKDEITHVTSKIVKSTTPVLTAEEELGGASPHSESRVGETPFGGTTATESQRKFMESTSHEDKITGIVDRLKSRTWWMRALGYLALGVSSFVVFLYLTFPYAVIKEGVVGAVSDSLQRMGVDARLSIGSLRPDWFTGVALENVTLVNTRDTSSQVRFGLVKVRLGVLSLLLGRVGVSAYVSQSGGSMEADFSLPISGLLSGRPSLRSGEVRMTSFQIDSFVGQILSILKSSKSVSPTLIPLISATSAGGFLSGKISLAVEDFMNTDTIKGRLDLNVRQMYLHINDNILQIPRQEFSVARIDATLDRGAVVFGNSTAFVAPDIDLSLGGRVGSGGKQGMIEANLALKLAMRRRVQENIGNIVPVVLKCFNPLKEKVLEDGKKEWLLDARLVGPLTSFVCEQG